MAGVFLAWERNLPDLRLTGAEILGPDGMHREGVAFADGTIVDTRSAREVDLSGYIILPGIIDLHGDGFERHLAPRRGAMKQMAEGLVAVEAELAANGITTAVLAQFVSWEGGVRGLEFADQVFQAIRDTAPCLVTDIRAQLRLETHLLEIYKDIPALVQEWAVRYVVFNDHLPHDRLAEGRQPPRMVGQALKAGRSPEAHFAFLKDLHARSVDVPEALDFLCAELTGLGVQLGSHDDATAEARAVWRDRGVRIAEFPETLEAAEAAQQGQDNVVLGAPNVVRGGSHKGNASAIDLITFDLCDAIASDYHYPSPRRAALLLQQSGLRDWVRAWHLVSAGPAQVLGLQDRGVLAPGLRADMVILNARSKRVAATVSGGRFSYLSGEIADRFFPA
ncbi:MAG: alpha-D-ribose 1-methylphosphonate 5-triphosphate diphosphatase [Roseobacter sp.]|jgi:alpha-D-ribose 1-methylphosphonate 5-triphosphate diphosphatase|nr:alpha-D-ribose 1-methylphosphonate 5-triphosphate diphosphatase [Roseobacter sp.]